MNCIVLLFPGSEMEQGTLFKHLGELGVCLSVEQSQSSNILQCLEKLVYSSSNPNVQKDAEKNLSADSAPVAGQHTKSNRGGSEECASNGSDDLAGEAHQGDGVEQKVSAGPMVMDTACEGSSSGLAAGIEVRHVDSNTTVKSQEQSLAQGAEQSSEQKRGGKGERVKKHSTKSSAGAALTGCGVKQQQCGNCHGDKSQCDPKAGGRGCVTCGDEVPTNRLEQERGERHRKAMLELSAAAGSSYTDISKCTGSCLNCGLGHHLHTCPEECRRCHSGPPMSCRCWRWMQRRKRERAGLEPLECAPSFRIQSHEESRSCSKKRAYNALRDFVSNHPYVMLLQSSDTFDLQVEDQLRVLLESMRWDDRSTLHLRAKSYHGIFGTVDKFFESCRKAKLGLTSRSKGASSTSQRKAEQPHRNRQWNKSSKRGPPSVRRLVQGSLVCVG